MSDEPGSVGVSGADLVAQLGALAGSRAWDEALSLVVANWSALLEPELFTALVDLVEELPVSVVADNPVLALGAGGALLVWGRSRRAGEFFDLAVVRDDPAARATALALRAHATWWLTAPEDAFGHLDEAAAILDANPGQDLVAVPGFEPLTSGRTMLTVSRARALALAGQVGSAANLMLGMNDVGTEDPVAESVSAWATKAWIDAMAGNLGPATVASDRAVDLAGDEWAGTPSVAPAHLARALVGCASGNHDLVASELATATTTARRARAWGLVQVCSAVAAMCGVAPEPTDVDAIPGPGLVPLAARVLGAHRARTALLHRDEAEAGVLLSMVQPTELALGAWVEVSLSIHGPELTAEVLADLPAPSTPAGRLIRATVDAALAPSPVSRDRHLKVALTLASHLEAPGILLAAPASVVEWIVAMARPDQVAVLAARRVASPVIRAPGGPALTGREREVLAMLEGPLTVNEIGQRLYLSPHTAKWHVARIYRQLGVHSRAEAVERSRGLGLL